MFPLRSSYRNPFCSSLMDFFYALDLQHRKAKIKIDFQSTDPCHTFHETYGYRIKFHFLTGVYIAMEQDKATRISGHQVIQNSYFMSTNIRNNP